MPLSNQGSKKLAFITMSCCLLLFSYFTVKKGTHCEVFENSLLFLLDLLVKVQPDEALEDEKIFYRRGNAEYGFSRLLDIG